jgi:hypothetical protein
MTVNLHISEGGLGVKASSLLDFVFGEFVLARKDTSRDGVIGVEFHVIVLEAGKQLFGDRASDRVVVALVDRWTDVSILLADFVDLGHDPGGVV